jgi:nuclear transport factor 2 (NTF2) superfamily protein
VTIHGRDEIEKHLAKQWSTQLKKKQSTRLFVGTEKRVVMTIERSWEDAENKKHKESGVACWELDANGAVVNRVFVSEPNLSASG